MDSVPINENVIQSEEGAQPQDGDVPEDILDSIKFGEEIKIDWRKYPLLHRKCWDM